MVICRWNNHRTMKSENFGKTDSDWNRQACATSSARRPTTHGSCISTKRLKSLFYFMFSPVFVVWFHEQATVLYCLKMNSWERVHARPNKRIWMIKKEKKTHTHRHTQMLWNERLKTAATTRADCCWFCCGFAVRIKMCRRGRLSR